MTAGALVAALVLVSALLLGVLWTVWSAVAAVERSKRHPDQGRPERPSPRSAVPWPVPSRAAGSVADRRDSLPAGPGEAGPPSKHDPTLDARGALP